MPPNTMSDMQSPAGEAGATDNRLSLNPNAWGEEMQDWKDGQRYTVTLTITQVSPGEYSVEDVKPSAEAPAAEGAEGEAAGEGSSSPDPRDPYPSNSVISKAMRGQMR